MDNFDLRKIKTSLLKEGYEEQGFDSEDEMENYYNDTDFIDETENQEGDKPSNEITALQLVANWLKLGSQEDIQAYVQDLYDKDIAFDVNDSEDLTKGFEEFIANKGVNEGEELDENQELDEMAKITGDLKSSIEKVISDNPELVGLALKKAIKGDASVQNALAGDDLYDNQLNKFIALSKGERTVGQRGRVADPNKPAAAPKEPKVKSVDKIKITNPKAAPASASTKLADLAPKSVFGGGEEDEEEVAAERQAIKAAGGNKRLGTAAEKLAQISAEMKALIPSYQAAKGTPEEADIVAQLKALTAEKKSLENKVYKAPKTMTASDLMGGDEA